MEVEKLSDIQLYALTVSQDLSHDLKRVVVDEFKKRSFSIGYVDELALKYESQNKTINKIGLSLQEKILIIIFPFFIPIQAILANRHISQGNMTKWKQHWQFVTMGFLLWTIVVIFLARFYFFTK